MFCAELSTISGLITELINLQTKPNTRFFTVWVKVVLCLVPLMNYCINQSMGKLTMKIKTDELLNYLITSEAYLLYWKLTEFHSVQLPSEEVLAVLPCFFSISLVSNSRENASKSLSHVSSHSFAYIKPEWINKTSDEINDSFSSSIKSRGTSYNQCQFLTKSRKGHTLLKSNSTNYIKYVVRVYTPASHI